MAGAGQRKLRKLNHWTSFDTVITIIAVFSCFITIYPMWYVLCMSFSDPGAVVRGEVAFWPVGFTLDSYRIVVPDAEFWRAFLNSILYVVSGCILMLFTTIAVAYPLTRPNLKGRKFLNIFLIIPMYFSGGMIPSFILITKLGMYNSPFSLIIPGCYSIWNIILCRTFLRSIPAELGDAVFIDGATNMQALRKIYIPLAKPVLAVIMIYTVVGIWNSWFAASIYTTKKSIQPVQLFLRNVLINQQNLLRADTLTGMTQQTLEQMAKQAMSAKQLRYTMIVLVTFPILLVYPMFQKHFTKGIMLGSLKG